MTAPALHDLVMESSTTAGTGPKTLLGAVDGYFTFLSRYAADESLPYTIKGYDADGIVETGEMQVGRGHINGGGALVCDTVEAGSNGTSPVAFTSPLLLAYAPATASVIAELHADTLAAAAVAAASAVAAEAVLRTAADATHAALTTSVHGISAFGATLVDDADAAAARTTLGLGTAATKAVGTGSSDVAAGDAPASAVATHAALTSSVHGISAFGATLVDDADAAAARTTLGLGTAATKAVGTGSSDVAAGDAPASAVATHAALTSAHGATATPTASRIPLSSADGPLDPLWLPRGRRFVIEPSAGGSTTLTLQGFASGSFGTQGTITGRTPLATSILTATERVGWVSAAPAGSLASYRYTLASWLRGAVAGVGGFLFEAVFCTSDVATVAGRRAFIGLGPTGAPSNVEPNTVNNAIGLGQLSTSNNWAFISRSATAATTTDLGSSFPANTLSADLIRLRLRCEPNASSVAWDVKNLSTGATASGTESTNLPVATTFMSVLLWATNNATALAVGIDLAELSISKPNL